MSNDQDDQKPLSSEELIERARRGLGDPGAADTSDPSDADDGASNADVDVPEPRRDSSGRPPSEPDTESVELAAASESDELDHPYFPHPGSDVDESSPPPAPAEAPRPAADEAQPWPPPPEVPRYERPKASSGFGRFFSIGRYVLGGLLLVVFLGQCFGSGTTLDSLKVGECFEDPGIGVEVSNVETIDCNELHDFELYATFELGSSDRFFPGQDALFTELETECVNRFPAYVGRDYFTSAYDFVSFAPIEEGWKDGDRTSMCAVYEFDSAFNVIQSTGTARQSGR